jgi:predicted phosphodiesterase
MSDQAALDLLRLGNADLICAGHTHRPMQRIIGRHRIVNLGAVSLSVTDDKRSSYALLNARTDGYDIEHRQVAFDRERVAAMLEAIDHPGRAFILRHLRG